MAKFPNINVQLTGEDGNAFAMVARVATEMKKAGVSKEEREEFFNSALSGDYDNVLAVIMETVNVT